MIDDVELPDVVCYVFVGHDVLFSVDEETGRTLIANLHAGEQGPVTFTDWAGGVHTFRMSAINGVERTTSESRIRDAKLAKLAHDEPGPGLSDD